MGITFKVISREEADKKYKEYKEVLSIIRTWNDYAGKYDHKYLVDEKRANYGYDCLNSIVYEMDNVIRENPSKELHAFFQKHVFVPVMNWQNGFNKGAKP